MIDRFVCAGSLNVDITFPVERLPEEHEKLRCRESYLTYGGAAANTAYWLARLRQPVTLLGCVGDDPFGSLAIADLAEVGVDTHQIQHARSSLTGMAAIFVNPRSKRMVTSGGANNAFDPALVDDALFAPGVHLHVATSLHHLVLPLMRQAKERGASVSCDLQPAPDKALMPYLDWVFMNHSDLRRWTGSDDMHVAAKRLPPHVRLVVTEGDKGARVLGDHPDVSHPAAPTKVVDRTGGGDAFVAGFLCALAQDRPLPECLKLGLRLAAQVIAGPGARPATVDVATAKAWDG